MQASTGSPQTATLVEAAADTTDQASDLGISFVESTQPYYTFPGFATAYLDQEGNAKMTFMNGFQARHYQNVRRIVPKVWLRSRIVNTKMV